MTSIPSSFAAYLQGAGVGLSGGYFAAWWYEGTLMYVVAGLAVVLITLGYAVDKRTADSADGPVTGGNDE